MKLRSLAIGLSLLTAGTVIGVSSNQFAAADVSSGDRPVLVPIEPCRLVDTRPGDATVGPRASRIGATDTLTVDAQEGGTMCTGKIPADALSLALNVTAIGATERTFLTIWAGGTRPDASSLNPAPGAPPTPNAVTVELSIDQEFEIYNNLGTLNVIVDVTGYYANHNHDDRYPTRAEMTTQAESQRFINLPTFHDVGGAEATSDGGSSTLRASVVLPPDYTTGTPLRIRMNYVVDYTAAGGDGCTLTTVPTKLIAVRPSTRQVLARSLDRVQPGMSMEGSSTITFPAGSDYLVGSAVGVITAPGAIPFEAGDSVAFSFSGSLSCGARMQSAAMYYD